MSGSKGVFEVRTRVSVCRYARCLGRVDESTASSRTKKKKAKTDKTDAGTDVGRVSEKEDYTGTSPTSTVHTTQRV